MRAALRLFVSSGFVAVVFLILAGCSTSRSLSSQINVETEPDIYNTQSDGETQLAVALAKAGRERKRVLLNLGANWCSDSHGMHRLLHDDLSISDELARHYVIAMVDVNERDETPRNVELLSRFENPLERGIPVLLVLSADGMLLNSEPAERLADIDHENPNKVLNYLRKWATYPISSPRGHSGAE